MARPLPPDRRISRVALALAISLSCALGLTGCGGSGGTDPVAIAPPAASAPTDTPPPATRPTLDTPSPPPPTGAAPTTDHPFIAGVSPHLAWSDLSAAAVAEKLRDLGTTSIRDESSWAAFERQPGVFSIGGLSPGMRAALTGGLDVSNSILLLDYGNPFYNGGRRPIGDTHIQAFVNYAVNLIRAGGWRFGFIEVWNEWNIGIGGVDTTGGTAEDYAKLFKAVAQAIRPLGNFRILVGGAVDALDDYRFQREIVDLGVLEFADGFGHHSYNFSDRARSTPTRLMARLNDIQGFLTRANGDRPVPIYITEAGWPIWGDAQYTDDQAGRWIAEFLDLTRATSWIKGVWIYNLFDIGTNPTDFDHSFGIYDVNGRDKDRTPYIREAFRAVNR